MLLFMLLETSERGLHAAKIVLPCGIDIIININLC